jgi:hypothetical protein
VHFTKVRTKHNSAGPLILLTTSIYPSPSAGVLNMILAKELSWQPHLHHIQVQASHPDQCPHSINRGRLSTGSKPALHYHHRPSYHHWLPYIVDHPFCAILWTLTDGGAPKGQKPLSHNCLWGLQSHTSTKPPGRSRNPTSVPPHRRLVGTIVLEVCRVRDSHSDW